MATYNRPFQCSICRKRYNGDIQSIGSKCQDCAIRHLVGFVVNAHRMQALEMEEEREEEREEEIDEEIDEGIEGEHHQSVAPEVSATWGFTGKLLVLLLAILVPLGVHIHSLPAYIVLPWNEVEPVNMICSPRTKEEIYQNLSVLKKQSHRTLCTFNVFHYDLRSRNKTYFMLDIDIDIAEAFSVSNAGMLFTMKLFHLNKKQNTYHKQRNMYWAVSWCYSNDELGLCLDDMYYRRETRLTQKVISKVVMGQKKVVSFLFVVNNDDKIMHIFSPINLLKDVVFLQHYYDEQTLSLWISLSQSKLDKYLSARIRSGAHVTIGDLPNPVIATNYEIIKGVFTYPFHWLSYHLWTSRDPPPTDDKKDVEETMHSET
ncbi:uncharacterized protein LOC117345213 [Pecten maximus]|uniref:uncharacterized protein LOC117345213 n=1 Tax=Pecten maximus TaxID=6579 RepID=UPI001458DB5B|nr:uncharacterized protein LOC117345213 [Pecten maximus]